MSKGIFDSHAHYNDEAFDDDRSEVLNNLPSKNIDAVINCGTDIESSLISLELAEKYDYIYAACGIHPEDALNVGDDYLEILKELLQKEKCVAVGEIGLDYHYDTVPRDVQIKFFEEQIKLSLEFDKPVIVHDREAHEDTMNLLRKYRPRGVIHCFSGSVEMAKEAVSLGLYIGLGGAVTFKNARKPCEVAAFLPDDRLLVETDCPYMSPVPFRGKRNDSSLISYTAEKLAEIRNTTAQNITELTNNNARALFKI